MWIDDSDGRPGAPAPTGTVEESSTTPSATAPEPTPAEARFQSCRWSVDDGGPPYCSNPEVLPYAGKGGFSAESWCLDCALYKVRRKAQKRRLDDDDYLY